MRRLANCSQRMMPARSTQPLMIIVSGSLRWALRKRGVPGHSEWPCRFVRRRPQALGRDVTTGGVCSSSLGAFRAGFSVSECLRVGAEWRARRQAHPDRAHFEARATAPLRRVDDRRSCPRHHRRTREPDADDGCAVGLRVRGRTAGRWPRLLGGFDGQPCGTPRRCTTQSIARFTMNTARFPSHLATCQSYRRARDTSGFD